MFASFLIVCLSSLSRQGSANRRPLSTTTWRCQFLRLPLASHWSPCSLNFGSISSECDPVMSRLCSHQERPPPEKVSHKMVNPELITNKSMRPYLHIIILFISSPSTNRKPWITCLATFGCSHTDVMMLMLHHPLFWFPDTHLLLPWSSLCTLRSLTNQSQGLFSFAQ